MLNIVTATARAVRMALLIGGIAACACGACACGAFAGEPVRVRVLSYNIHRGLGVDGRIDLKRIAGVINSVTPDIVALQEVDRHTQRSGDVDQAGELAELTDMRVIYGPNIPYSGGQYGNAVLTKWKVERDHNHRLPSYDGGEQRGVLAVRLSREADASSLLFLCTHLDHRDEDRERVDSVRTINRLLDDSPDLATLLAGDLNATPDSRVLSETAERWRIANQDPLATIPVDRPTRQIDYILVHPPERWKTIEVRVLDEAVASDHRPIFAILEMSRAE